MRTALRLMLVWCSWLPLHAQAIGPEEIGVNQVGYRIGDEKDFRAARPVAKFKILNERNEAVFEGKLTGPVHDQYAGCDVWRGVFTDLNKTGIYIIQLADGTRSWPFEIGDEVYVPLLQTALRGLYVSRCGYEVKDDSVGHPPCHTRDGAHLMLDGKPVPDGRDVTGSWHNGGDYWRSTMSAAQTVSRLLWPEELFPAAFDNVPSRLLSSERWDRFPDLLTEARWGLDWLAKLQSPDGGIALGVAPYPGKMPSFVPPQDDPSVHYVGAVHSSNTAKGGAVFARAARVLKERDPRFTQACLEKPRACWKYLLAHPQPVAPPTCQTYVKRADEDDRLWLAVELFRATGEKEFHDEFRKRFTQLATPYPPAPVSTQTIRNFNLHEALISYCFVRQGADKEIQAKILSGLRTDCDRMVATATANGYGCVLAAENWKHRHTTGNALQMAWELAMAFELTGHAPYREVAIQQFHFVLGANPLGKVFVTGVGSNPVRNPHYRPFSIKRQAPPGLLVKGPTHDAQFLEKTYKNRTPPPPEKAYVDVVAAHWCNEPDIEVQGHLIGLAAYFSASPSKRGSETK